MSMEELPPSGRRPGGLGGPPKPKTPICPQCQRSMKVKQVAPVLFATAMDDIMYGCDDCGTEAKRTVKRA